MRDTLAIIGLAVLGLLLIPAVAVSLFTAAPTVAHAQVMCTMQYDPVCAAQPVQCIKAPCYPQYHTYGNACMAGAAGATIIHAGECLPNETGPVIPQQPQPTYTPPPSCVAWFDGCNSCTKTNGGTACTKRYCAPEVMQPGYCTAYQTPAPATTTPPVIIYPPVYLPPIAQPAPLPWWLWLWHWRWW